MTEKKTVLCSVLVYLVSCSPLLGQDNTSIEEKDHLLVQAVTRAFAKKPTPLNIDSMVGFGSDFNTVKAEDRLRMGLLRIGIDPEYEMKRLAGISPIKDLVFWVRPVESKYPRIVGICWRESGDVQFFFGRLAGR